MNEHTLRPAAIRTLIVCVLLAAAWIFTVKPARADLDDQRRLFGTQSAAVSAYLSSDPDEQRTRSTQSNLESRVHSFADAMTAHATTAALFEQIERNASARSIRIHRTDPRSSNRVQSGPDRRRAASDEPVITADEFLVEFSGRYGDITAFIAEIPDTVGLAQINSFRLTRGAGDQVRGTLTLTVYRVPDRTTIIPDPAETRDDA